MAAATLKHVSDAIDKDLYSLEEDLAGEDVILTEGYLTELKYFCVDIHNRINVDLKEAAEKLARLDRDGTSGACRTITNSMADFENRLRDVQAMIRKKRGSATPSSTRGTSLSGQAASVRSDNNLRGYMPLERIKPPTFSGKVEEWPEFRSILQDFFSDLPEIVHIQHIS